MSKDYEYIVPTSEIMIWLKHFLQQTDVGPKTLYARRQLVGYSLVRARVLPDGFQGKLMLELQEAGPHVRKARAR